MEKTAPSSASMYFTELNDESTITPHLQEAVTQKIQLQLHAEDQSMQLKMTFAQVDAAKKFLFTLGDVTADQLTYYQNNRAINTYYKIGDILYSFSVPIRELNAKAILLEFPQIIRTYKKRQFYRIEIPESSPITVSFSDPENSSKNLKKLVLDLSMGGLSFFTSAEESQFQKGVVLRDVIFTLPSGKVITTNADIRYI